MPPSNVDLLTHSYSVLKAKKKAKKQQVAEVVFDDSARYEYLTGFHKRNLLKKQAAITRAKERERQERLRNRAEQRRALQEQAERNVKSVEKAYRNGLSSDEDEPPDLATLQKGKGKEKQEAYEDEEQLATVTVVEEFDPDTLLHPTPAENHRHPTSSPAPSGRTRNVQTRPVDVRGTSSGSTKANGKVTRKKRFTYETKAAKKAAKVKSRARRTEKAERAGEKKIGGKNMKRRR